ncbi:MAG: hypothetical protein JO107_05465 [Hyphomicrobiales bacterium]|nr:hypothetical protein [Hyphomicrobiales bacterium]MBV8662531.1 hypothetical protein [Hyphomicrobiales bacterium]
MKPVYYAVCASILSLIFAYGVIQAQIHESVRPLLTSGSEFIADQFFSYIPDAKTVFIPKRFLQSISVKENLVHTSDGFVRQAGSIETVPFTPSRYMAIPIMGGNVDAPFFSRQQSRVYLRCLSSSAEIDLLSGPSAQYFLATVYVPKDWCDGQVSVVAKAGDADHSVGVGTPFRIGRATWAMSGRLGSVIAAVIAFALIAMSTIPIIAMGRYPLLQRLTMALLWPSLFGYVLFVQQWYVGSVDLSAALSLLYLFGPIALFTYESRRGRAEADIETTRVFMVALGVTFGVVLLAPYLLIPIQNGFWFPCYAFFPATWSTDNLLSEMTAKSVLAAGAVHPYFLGPFSLTDRGVIQVGDFIGLLTLPFIKIVVSDSVAGADLTQFYGAAIQALAIPSLVVLVCRRIVPGASALAVALLLATTPFFLMNTFYIWPKLSGGILVVASFFLLEEALRKTSSATLSLAVTALFFGVMNHSANLISLITVVVYCGMALAIHHHKFSDVIRLARSAALPIAGLVIAFVAMERLVSLVEPKSSYPLTFLLTGNGEFGLSKEEVTSRAVNFYRAMTPASFIALKTSQVMDLIWIQGDFFARSYPGFSILGTIRAREFFSLVPSLGPGIIIGVGAMLAARFQRLDTRLAADDVVDHRLFGTAMIWAASSAVTLVIYAALFNMPMIVHHLPYGAVIAIILAAVLFIARFTAIFRLATGIQFAATALVWFFGAYYTWYHELLAR